VSTRLPSAAPASLVAGAIGLCIVSALGSLESCAHVAAPPGGPRDTIPPLLIAVLPDSYAVVPGFDDDVKFEFSESISERGVESSTTLYPFEPRPRVKKGGRELRVRPREGWVDDRIYHIRVEPVITDLFQNEIEQPIVHVISTGLPIPENRTQGIIYDRITAKPLPGGRIDMVRMPDSLRYGGVADSVGAFGLEMIPTGDYLAIGYEDVNNNRQADAFDRSDTVEVSLGAAESLTLDFRVFRHDTIGPRLIEVKAVDTLIVELTFDGYLDPEAPLDTRNVEIYAVTDSLPIQLDTVLHAWQYTAWRDSVQAVRRAAADSVAAAAAADSAAAAAAADTLGLEADTLGVEPDTLGIGPDTLTVPPDTVGAVVPPPVGQAAEAEPTEEGQEEAEADEPAILPDQRIYVVARARLPSGTHVARFVGVLNLNQLPGAGEAEFEPIEPPPQEVEEEEPPPDPPPGPDR
jgi:hypothetical protein